MKTISEYIDDVAKTTETGSDYAAAQVLGITQNRISRYRREGAPDPYTCALIAQRLGVPVIEVMSAAERARAERLGRREQADYWEKLWKRVRQARNGAATAIIALVVFGSFSMPSMTYAKSASDGSLYYAHWLRRLRAMLGGSLLPA